MPNMTIRVVNATFESSDTGDYDTVDDAFRAAVIAGIEIASGEVSGGSKSAIVEIEVDTPDQKRAARGAVSVSMERFSQTSSG